VLQVTAGILENALDFHWHSTVVDVPPARRANQKGVIHFSIQRIVFATGCTEKFGLIDRLAVSQQ